MKPARNLLVDAARMFFAYGVIAIHLAPNTPAAGTVGASFVLFAVPFFLTVGLYFFIGKLAGGDTVPRVRDLRFDRLWLPYLAWTLVYLGLHLGKDFATHHQPHVEVLATIFYGGAAVHLYFLPLLLLFQCWALVVALFWRAPERRPLAGALLAGSAAFAVGGTFYHALGFERVFLDGALYLAGAWVLWTFRGSARFRRWNTLGCLALAAGLLALVLTGDPWDWLRFGHGPLAGYAAASLALGWTVSAPLGRGAAFLLGCSYGIYLAHFVFLEAFEFLAVRMGWNIKPYDVPEKLSVAFGISVCCVGFIAVVRASRPARAWLLGEGTRDTLDRR